MGHALTPLTVRQLADPLEVDLPLPADLKTAFAAGENAVPGGEGLMADVKACSPGHVSASAWVIYPQSDCETGAADEPGLPG
jgi:hypothetical protein